MPLENGFRGAILLEAGNYKVSSTLKVTQSGIVLRGAGHATTISYTSTEQSNLLEIEGVYDVSKTGRKVEVADEFCATGSTTFSVTPGHSFTPGTRIIIKLSPNDAWLRHMSDMTQWGWTSSQYRKVWRRVVTSVDGDQITIDAPLVQAIAKVYGGADVYAYDFEGEISQVGVENMRLDSTFSSDTDEDHGWIAIRFQAVCNAWVRQVTGKDWGFGLVSAERYASFITVEDSAIIDHKSEIRGGRRYSFHINNAEFVLFQRCLSQEGRHEFASGSRTSGPNVFVDCLALNQHADIGPHHRYATGQLYDNIRASEPDGSEGRMRVQNREDSGSGHGWTGAQIMFWNNETSIVCDAPNNGMNWAIGNVGTHEDSRFSKEKSGMVRSIDAHVTPRSLYYAQLQDRFKSANALRHVLLPSQKMDPIWSELEQWKGEGLLLEALVTFVDEEALPISSGDQLKVGGIVRDLALLDLSPSFAWTKVEGPGEVSFTDESSLETEVQFDSSGEYELQFVAQSGEVSHSATLSVVVT